MSENLVSEPMTVEDSYGNMMYPVIGKQESSTANILMESHGSLDFNSTLPQVLMPNMKSLQSEQRSESQQFEERPLSPMANNTVAPQILVPNWSMQKIRTPETKSAEQKTMLPNKRKATLELISNDPSSKKVAHASSLFKSSGMQALSVPNKKVVPLGSMSNSPRSMVSSKKKLPVDGAVNRSQPPAQKNRNASTNQPAKAQSESSNSVRSKLRESLAAALALVCQENENSSNAEKNDHSLVRSKGLGDSPTPRLASDTGDACNSNPGSAGEATAANEECRNTKSPSETADPKDISGDTVGEWKFVGQEFQSNPVLTYEDASFNDGFFGKDELLLGNGLAWEMELDADIVHVKEDEASDKAKLVMDQDAGNATESNLPRSEPLPSPESVASKIESELFKLFGGVNKKYKEKGRSLLFNLKDKSNPDLRERVMSGEIPPEKLCSMTAEELASKELSEWRIAKAEELSQMKVLPDEEVDLRRLVKKTHKGEFVVVEMERDVSFPVDITVGTSALSEDQPKETRRKANEDPLLGKKSSNEDVDDQCQLTISSDGGDVMHALMVDDMKDLPPIVSLDEFMESLDKEPPFENLHGDSRTPVPGKETSDVGGDIKSSDQTSKVPVKKTGNKSDEVDFRSIISNANLKSTSIKKGPEIYRASGLIKGERIWEGVLQLSISSDSEAKFVGIYKSGEKTSTKEWPRFIEIKGRVRLDAFQKFLQDLPMSRSRAVMVVHFVLAEDSTDNERKNLQELVDSYVADHRLGFAEPAPGFEIYYIPPETEMVDLLSKQLKDYAETLKTIDNGLIGIVVWRKAQLTTPTTPHRDNVKRQQHQPLNVGFASRSVVPNPSIVLSRSQPDNNNVIDDDDDDVPPGFGPPTTARDDDDLPEFNFSGSGGGRGGSNPTFNPSVPQSLSSPTPSRSVDQVRQLILKYGKGENGSGPSPTMRGGIPLQSWDDDDDDIPEWQPEMAPTQPQAQQPPMLPQQHMTNYAHLQQQPLPLAKPPQPPTGGGWWPGGPANAQPTHNRQAQNQGRMYQDGYNQQGRQWRSDGRRSRARGR